MNKCVALVITACTLVTGCRTAPHLIRWEYKVATLDLRRGEAPDANSAGNPQSVREAKEALLNDLGREGWVLVSQDNGRVFYLKRPVR